MKRFSKILSIVLIFTCMSFIVAAEAASDGDSPNNAQAASGQEEKKPSKAKSEDDAPEQKMMEEMTVTATRRETSVQTTAASIEALSGEKLEELGKINIENIIGSVPGVTVASLGAGRNRIIFRNIATSSRETGSSTTATYFDDFALSAFGGGSSPSMRLVDMERVEVLKGPQGTLFGRSAMAGIVRYISNKASTEGFSAGINTSFSSTTDGGTNFGGYVFANLPINDTLAIRVVAYNYQNDGYIDNVELGIADINTEDTVGGRFALHWDATEKLTFDLTYFNQSMDAGMSFVSSTWDPGDINVSGDEGPITPYDIDARTTMGGVFNENSPTYEALNLKFDYEFNSFTATFLATSLTSVYDYDYDDKCYVDLISGWIPNQTHGEQDTDVLEFRLVSSSDGFLDWIAGLYYTDQSTYGSIDQYYLGPDNLLYGFFPMTDGMLAIGNETLTDYSETAIYGELGLNFSSDTRLLLGYRRSDVEIGFLWKTADGFFNLLQGFNALQGIPFTSQEDVNTYKVSLEHTFNEDMFGYALASSGYRHGGFNYPTAVSPFSTYDSDTLWNYELGLKSTWMNGLLRANIAAYLLNYDDIQLVVQDPVSFARATRNVGSADVSGVEFGLSYFVHEYLSFSFSGSLSDPQLNEDVPPSLNPYTGETIYTGRKGDRLPGSTNESFSLGANWEKPLDNGMALFSNLSYRYTGDRLNNFNLDLDVALPAYSLTDLRLGIKRPNGWSAVLFADNLFDEAIAFYIVREGSFYENVPTNRPRTVGVNFSMNF